MIEQAEKKGILKPGGTIIEASSGNQGIATALIGALKGYKVIITATPKASKEKIDTIKAYGAEVIVCESASDINDPKHYHSRAVALHKSIPNSFMLNQYFNTANADGHYNSLGPEIWRQTNGTITHFFAGAGSGGTVSGAGRYLKEQKPSMKVIALDSINSFYTTKGNPKPYCVEGMGIDWDSPVLNHGILDQIIPVSDENALGMLKTMAHAHGLLVGPSSGAVAYATQEFARGLSENDVAVMIMGDSGRAYLTKNLYS